MIRSGLGFYGSLCDRIFVAFAWVLRWFCLSFALLFHRQNGGFWHVR